MAGREITVNSRKYDGTIRRSWACELVESSDGVIVLEGVFEQDVEHADLGNIARGTRSVEYFWPARWYNIFRFHNPDGNLRNWYCNVNMPPRFTGDTIDYVDLDIDIVVWPDMSHTVLDTDEFQMNAERFSYPPEIIRNAENAVAELILKIESRSFPFKPRT